MKPRLALALITLLWIMVQPVLAKTLEVEVHGMTCAFCVDSLKRKLTAMPAVAKVQVSLKTKKVRLETKEGSPSIEAIKQAILDAGFTPVNIKILTDGNHQK